MAKVKRKYERINDKDFYKLVALTVGMSIAGVYAVNLFNFQKVPKASSISKQEMKLEKIVDVDTFETIEPIYDSKNDSVYFNVEDRRNHVNYGKLTGGKLEISDINRNIVFEKKYEENEVVEVKSGYLVQDKYMVKYNSGSTHYNIMFGKK